MCLIFYVRWFISNFILRSLFYNNAQKKASKNNGRWSINNTTHNNAWNYFQKWMNTENATNGRGHLSMVIIPLLNDHSTLSER